MVHVRKKSGKYYYLEHTIRSGRCFENRTEYLGKNLPENVDVLENNFMLNLFDERYSKDLEKIKKKFNKDFSSYPSVAKKKYFENFMIKFTYNSNKIEGGTLTLKETFDLLQDDLTPKNKSLKDVKETEAHKLVFNEMLNYKKNLSLATVLHWHKLLLQNVDVEIAGKIRKHPVAIARSKVQLALPVEIDSLLYDFFKWYKKNEKSFNPVILAALVHLKFVTIHPFSDGNGRISRLLMNFVLHKHGYPMLNVHYAKRVSYYNALEKSQIKNKNYIFVKYFVKRYLKEYFI